ncbi:MAG TPA: PRC-barrel domain-containing protein [Roseomonas sp.]
MATRSPFLTATLIAGMLAAPAIAFGQQAAPDGTPGNPPGTAAGRAVDRASGQTTAPDGTPGNPPGTAVGRAVDRTLGTNMSGANPQADAGRAPTSEPGATATNPIPHAPGTAAVDAAATDRASRIIGAKIYNERNEAIGDVDDLIVHASGQAPTAVLSVGGFLGIGARLVAVPLSELRFNTDGERWVLNGATRETLQARPAFTYRRT